jgi:hypothetical protein
MEFWKDGREDGWMDGWMDGKWSIGNVKMDGRPSHTYQSKKDGRTSISHLPIQERWTDFHLTHINPRKMDGRPSHTRQACINGRME